MPATGKRNRVQTAKAREANAATTGPPRKKQRAGRNRSPTPPRGAVPEVDVGDIGGTLAQIVKRLDAMEKTARDRTPPDTHKESGNGQVESDIDSLLSDPASDSEFQLEPLNRPLQQYGTLVGDDVSKKLKRKVRSDKFVEFWELLPNPDRAKDDSFVFSASTSSDLKIVKKRQKKFISFQQWSRAFDIYMAIYIDKADTASEMSLLVKDLLTYRREVESLYAAGRDWFQFDNHFRTDREVNPCRFSTVRHDLLRQYERVTQPFRKFDRAHQPFREDRLPSFRDTNFRSQDRQSSATRVPLGFCRAFHTQGQRCEFQDCKYKHQCPSCGRRHPMFATCFPPRSDGNRRPNSAQAPKPPRQPSQPGQAHG